MGGISLGRVTVLLLGGRATGYVLALANSIVVARLLGPERLGVYGYAMGLAGLFALLPNMGVSTVVTRAVARGGEEDAGILRPALRAQVLFAAAALVAVVGLAATLPGGPATLGHAALAGTQLAVGTLSWPYLAVLSGHARFDRLVAAELGAAAVGTASIVTAAVLDGGVTAFLWAHVVASGGAVVVARVAAAPFRVGPSAATPSLGALLRQATPFGATAAAQSLYTRLDIVLLGQLAPALAVGLYSAAYKPVNFAVYLGGTVAGALFPLMARTGGELPLSFHRAVRALAITGPALALLLTGLAEPLLRLLYGSGFAPAAGILAVLAWSVVANWLYAPLGVALQARGRERGWLLCLSIGVAVNATVNVLAIPRWGAVGAAAATLVSEIVLLLAGIALVARASGSLAWLRPLVIPAGAAVAAGVVLGLLLGELGGVPAALAALAVYGACLVLCRAISAQDVGLVVGWVREALRV